MKRLAGRIRAFMQQATGSGTPEGLGRRVEDLESEVRRLRRELGAAIEYFDRTREPETGS